MGQPLLKQQTDLQIPSAYDDGYKEARAENKTMADNYIMHTTIGDPVLDPVMEELSSLPPKELHQFVEAGIEDQKNLVKAPKPLRDFFYHFEEPPWLDHQAFQPGIKSFNTNVDLMLVAFVTGVLVEGFSTLIAKSFYKTGRVLATPRRLMQNNRQLMEIFFPCGLLRNGDGYRLSMRIRFIHAQVRHLLSQSKEWDHAAWGTPLSAAHLGFASSVFSLRLLKYAKLVGARFNKEEQDSVLAVWRYTGYLMGVPESVLYTDAAKAEEIYKTAYMCEPPPDEDSITMSNALIQSIPSVVGITDPKEQKAVIRLAYSLSRALIGEELANKFQYPKQSRLSVRTTLFTFRMKQRLHRILKHQQLIKSENFSRLVQMSTYDETGISYRLPDHVKWSKSSKW